MKGSLTNEINNLNLENQRLSEIVKKQKETNKLLDQ